VCGVEKQGARLTLHDVVTVSDETEADGQGDDSDLPQRNVCFGADSLTSGPSRVHGSPDTDGVTDIVGTVREGGSAGGDNLDEGVQVLGLVGILGSVSVNALHTTTFGSAENTDLSKGKLVRLRLAMEHLLTPCGYHSGDRTSGRRQRRQESGSSKP
jgi:hypothetical protein